MMAKSLCAWGTAPLRRKEVMIWTPNITKITKKLLLFYSYYHIDIVSKYR
jgi:hypothetical protein